MALEIRQNVAGCCAIKSISGFWWDEEDQTEDLKEKKKAKMVKELEAAIKSVEEDGKSILFATVCTKQLLSEQALIEAGFQSASEDWLYRNPAHSNYETGVKMYWKQLYQNPTEE